MCINQLCILNQNNGRNVNKKYVLSLFIGVSVLIHADQVGSGPLQEIAVVSLGSHCQSSVILRELGMRQFATPLDWLLSLDHEGLVKLINDEFCYMFDERYLTQYPEVYVINNLYNLDLHEAKRIAIVNSPDVFTDWGNKNNGFKIFGVKSFYVGGLENDDYVMRFDL